MCFSFYTGKKRDAFTVIATESLASYADALYLKRNIGH